jgi:hypothetical protein
MASAVGIAAMRRRPDRRAALNQQHAELVLELLQRRRERRLGDAEFLGRLAEMPGAGQRDEEFELVDHGGDGRTF